MIDLVVFVYDFIMMLFCVCSLCISYCGSLFYLGVFGYFIDGVLTIIENSFFNQHLRSINFIDFMLLCICSRL